MIVPENWVYQQATMPGQQAVAPVPRRVFPGTLMSNAVSPVQVGVPWGALLLGGGLVIAGLVALSADDKPQKRYCGACGRAGHQRNNCPYTGQRAHFSRSIPKSRTCQCCGQSRYETQRHHPRGRADASDRLDVCGDCHVVCGHGGHYQNPARKPYVCRIMNRPSAWRG